ncbi:MAG: M48 family metalloprotease [Candidatus Dormibacteraeota bacterium]|nr:M48 family metalloprotease [Candidatus Dormibacteraeota bacterium]
MSVLGRVTAAALALGYLGVIPAAILLVARQPTALPLGLLGGLTGLLWGMSYVWALLPAPEVQPAISQRLRDHVSLVAAEAGLPPPQAFVSHRVSGASVSWCQGIPRVVFPSLWVEHLPDDELKAYVAHEVAHQTQLAYRASLLNEHVMPLVGGATLGMGLVVVTQIQRLASDRASLYVYVSVPIALTLFRTMRLLLRRRALVEMEVEADRQAVLWGAPAPTLASAIERVDQPDMQARLSPDRWLLLRILRAAAPREAPLRKLRLQALSAAGGIGRGLAAS